MGTRSFLEWNMLNTLTYFVHTDISSQFIFHDLIDNNGSQNRFKFNHVKKILDLLVIRIERNIDQL